MKKIWEKAAAFIPAYGRVPLILAVVFNMTVYGGSRMLTKGCHHFNIEGPLDALIPFWAAVCGGISGVLPVLVCKLYSDRPSGEKRGL